MHWTPPCASLGYLQGQEDPSPTHLQLMGGWVWVLPSSTNKCTSRVLHVLHLAFSRSSFLVGAYRSRGTMAAARSTGADSEDILGPSSRVSVWGAVQGLARGRQLGRRSVLGLLHPGSRQRLHQMSVGTDAEPDISGMLLTDPISVLPCSALNHKG